MKYMLLMNGTKADWEWYMTWPKKDLEAQMAFMRQFSKELKDSGVYVSAEGLGLPQEATVVRAGADGEPVTDGVFPESKEFLAGYFIIDVESREQALKIAARLSNAPSPGDRGKQPIEVRQVMSGPPEVQ